MEDGGLSETFDAALDESSREAEPEPSRAPSSSFLCSRRLLAWLLFIFILLLEKSVEGEPFHFFPFLSSDGPTPVADPPPLSDSVRSWALARSPQPLVFPHLLKGSYRASYPRPHSPAMLCTDHNRGFVNQVGHIGNNTLSMRSLLTSAWCAVDLRRQMGLWF